MPCSTANRRSVSTTSSPRWKTKKKMRGRSIDDEFTGDFLLQLQSMPGTAEIGTHRAAHGRRETVEEHRLDAGMIVEVFEMDEALHRAARVQMHRGRTVRRQRNAERIAQSGRLHEPGDAAAAGRIGLQDVDGAGF